MIDIFYEVMFDIVVADSMTLESGFDHRLYIYKFPGKVRRDDLVLVVSKWQLLVQTGLVFISFSCPEERLG